MNTVFELYAIFHGFSWRFVSYHNSINVAPVVLPFLMMVLFVWAGFEPKCMCIWVRSSTSMCSLWGIGVFLVYEIMRHCTKLFLPSLCYTTLFLLLFSSTQQVSKCARLKRCWPAGRVCTMQYLYSIYLAFSLVFSIFWSCNQLHVCTWCVLPFSLHSAVWHFYMVVWFGWTFCDTVIHS